MSTPFRFGLVGVARSRDQWLDLARRVEGLGFDSLLVPDNLDGVAPMLACTAAASVTTRLTVGPYVLATPLRTPGLVAAEAAALDLLAGGRVEVGLGAGRPDSAAEAARLGLPFGSPGERIDVLDRTIAAVRDRVPSARVTVAASGPRMLALAGRAADVVALGASPLADQDEYARMADVVRGAAGDRADQVVLNMNLTCVGDELPPWLAQRMGLTIEALRSANAAGLLTGSADKMAQTLVRRREATGVSYICAGSDNAERLAPVVRLLHGQ
ncbi:LLM class flavin-dependent oxidoreductase [Angustibacter sp. McL0619]|uniref:LLM class flavin-dependent oxidoreductase n=1 Tax=Angustibacter sp. McL0619 TaxID=3415676 RepID=UPI003CEA4C3A